jgi:hypothetical protein
MSRLATGIADIFFVIKTENSTEYSTGKRKQSVQTMNTKGLRYYLTTVGDINSNVATTQVARSHQ